MDWLIEHTGATRVVGRELVQRLWSDYGRIDRVRLEGGARESVILKLVDPSGGANGHPRGWATDLSHQRKLKSYAVESRFYERYSARSRARLPEVIAVRSEGEATWLLMEDLDAAGFPSRADAPGDDVVRACLVWLARFHASFLGVRPDGLWDVGTYWHLATRPDELEAMGDERLKRAAPAIDEALSTATPRTFVHGDAKIANFCIGGGGAVAAVDFQYVGGGIGLKDVAYFLGSCHGASHDRVTTHRWLDVYFAALRDELGADASAVEASWRPLFDHCWADFHRFLDGWAPGHWKLDGYGVEATERVLRELA